MTNTLREPSVPAGATADSWDLDAPLRPDSIRSLNWAMHDTTKVGVGVDGFMYGDGTVDRFIALYPSPDNELTASEARQLAAALLNAADDLDRL